MSAVLTILAMSAAPQVPEAASFALKAAAEVAGDRIYLGDVATCAGATRLCEEAYGIDLGPSPLPGKSRLLAEAEVRAVLEREWPGAALRFPETRPVKVTALAAVVTEEDVRAALAKRLSEIAGT